MSGSLVSLGRGFDFYSGKTFTGIGFGVLNEYPVVGKLQTILNNMILATAGMPNPFRIAGGTLTLDRKYGTNTNSALGQYIDWSASVGRSGCVGTSSSELNRNGPYNIRHCLMYYEGTTLRAMFSDAELAQLQRAWDEWKHGSGDSGERGSGGGGGGGGTTTTPPVTTPVASEESSFPWGVLVVLGLVGVGLYVVMSE